MKRLLLLTAAALQAAGPTGPVSGWTLDQRTAAIRAITGIPGALRLADPLPLSSGIASAEFSPNGDLAAALTTDQPAHFVVITALKTTAVITDLGQTTPDARILSINAKGTAALIYSAAQQTVRFATALDQSPALSDPISTAALAGPVTAGIFNSDGCAVLGTGSVEMLCPDSSSRRLIETTSLTVTALAITEKDLWIGDAAGQQILRVTNGNTSVAASQMDGILQPVALAVTPTGLVLAADSGAQAIFVLGPAGLPVQQIPLGIAPSQLRPLTDRTLLLINDLTALPFTLFTSEGMRTYFVPAN